jgi:hypothetical protein
MFIDASAMVAILTREPEADALADTLESARAPITSPLAIFGATLGVCRKRHASVAEGHADVLEFAAIAQYLNLVAVFRARRCDSKSVCDFTTCVIASIAATITPGLISCSVHSRGVGRLSSSGWS